MYLNFFSLLLQNAHKSLIKPIAFKPVVNTLTSRSYGENHRAQLSPHPPPKDTSPRIHTYGSNMRSSNTICARSTSLDSTPESRHYDPSTMTQSQTSRVTFDTVKSSSTNQMSPDDGYISQEYHSGLHSHSNSNTSHNSSMPGSHNGSIHNDSDRSIDRSMEQQQPQQQQQQPGPVVNTTPVTTRPHDRADSYNNSVSNSSRLSMQRGESFHLSNHQTPSPSDSGVGELEAMLRDKDATIQHLRQTMERNESAILQVCQEKEQNWEIELRDIHQEWERRWKHHQERTFKMEQALLLQLFKLQQERKTLKLDLESVKVSKEAEHAQFTECEQELKVCRAKVEEVSWDLAQKSGEIALLKSQLKDCKEMASHKGNDIVSIRTALKEAQHTSDAKDHEILTLEAQLKSVKEQLANANNEGVSMKRDVITMSNELSGVRKELHSAKQQVDLKELQMEMKCKELERLQSEHAACSTAKSSPKLLSPVGAIVNGTKSPNNEKQNGVGGGGIKDGGVLLKEEVEGMREEFMKEREQWLEEKNKVIRYQKHLQLNYVQMYRKNKTLESEVEQLTLELEKRDSCMMEPVIETEESIC